MTGLCSLHILIVDDNDNMRTIVTTMLKGAGITRVKEVPDGDEAIRTLGWFAADMAIVDFNMKPVDGLEFTRFMRTSPLSPNPFLPIILMTGHAERSRVLEAREAGVHDFLAKPITAKSLLTRMHGVLARPRSFVRAGDYFGPDRRRVDDEAYDGPLLRSSDLASSR